VGTSVKPDPASKAADGDDKEPIGPQLSPLEQALAGARALQKEKKSIIPVKEEPAAEGDETPAAEAEGDEKKEADDGETGEGEDAAGAEAEAEETPGADAEKPDEPETAEGDEATAEADEEVEDDPDLVVALPPRREGEAAIEIVAENKETAEALRRLSNMATRGADLEARETRVQTDQAQIEELEVFIGTDPVGFIQANVPGEVTDTVALALVTDPEVLARIKGRLFPALQDEKEMRVLRSELKGDRAEAKNTLRETIEVRRYAKEQAKTVRDTLQIMVPETEGISAERRAAIIETLEKGVGSAVREKAIQKISPEDLPVILTKELRAAGIDPLAAAQAIQSGGKAPPSEPGKSPAKKKVKRPTAKQLKLADAKRKKAATSAPPGAAVPASRPKLPAGQNLEDRMKLVREKGIGALMGGG
jgi:hypothetical protein